MESTEEWRPIVGHPDYEVSNLGAVRSIDRWIEYAANRGRRFYRGRVLRPTRNGTGYMAVTLGRGGNQVVHLLVLEAFVGPRPEGMRHARHLTGDTADNRLANLAWGTFSENQMDSVSHGTHFHGRKTHCKRGHEFTPENTYSVAARWRQCKACTQIRERSRRRSAA